MYALCLNICNKVLQVFEFELVWKDFEPVSVDLINSKLIFNINAKKILSNLEKPSLKTKEGVSSESVEPEINGF